MSELEDTQRARLSVEAQRLQAETHNRQRDGVVALVLAVGLVITLFLLFDRMGW